MSFRSRLLALTVAAASVLGACSSEDSRATGAAGSKSGASQGSGDGSWKAGSTGSGAVTGGTGGTAAATANPYERFTNPPLPSPPPEYYDLFFDVVNISVPEDESWGGETCVPPRAGSKCTILFRGVAFLAKDDKGTVLIQIIEDERPVPKTLYRQAVVKGRSTIYEWVPYEVPAGVRTVITKAVLLDSKGVPVAESPPQRHHIS